MAALTRALLAIGALCSPVASIADPIGRYADVIAEASARFGIPEAWIRRVMQAESGGRPLLNGRPIVSIAGAMGLMQLMPRTWQDVRASLGLGQDPFDPHDNILAGTFYLRAMYDRFGYPGLFGAYNAGPARYTVHLATGQPLPRETRVYVANLSGIRVDLGRTKKVRDIPSLFAVRAEVNGVRSDSPQPSGAARSLFVRAGERSDR